MSPKIEHSKIKIPVLIPFTIALLLLLSTFITAIYWLRQRSMNSEVLRRIEGIDSLFQAYIEEDSRFLNGLLDFLEKDEDLQNAFLGKNRDVLLQYAEPIFQEFRAKYDITHFYFHNTDKSCFLRAHNPPEFGDHIERFTLNQAANRQKSSWGIELGPFGTFTLRVVHPWYIDNKLAGYLELGREIGYITPRLKQVFGVELVFVINKSYLDRQQWQEGLRMMGRTGNWDLLADFVVIDSTTAEIPFALAKNTVISHAQHQKKLFKVSMAHRKYRSGFVRLRNAAGQDVGDIIVLDDITEDETALKILLIFIIITSVTVGAVILALFYLDVRKIEQKLTIAHNNLEDEIIKRTQAENELRIHRDNLELLVQQRTAELQKSNTELEQQIAEREKTVDQLNHSNQELRHFAHVIAHDLKSPVRGIATLAQWLSTDYYSKFDQHGREQIDFLSRRAQRLGDLIDALLKYSEIGLKVNQKRDVSLNDLIDNVVAEINPPENIKVTVGNDLPTVFCNGSTIADAFRSLLSNAIKYMDKPQGQVEIACIEENGFWKFSISDNGPGIEEKYFEKIFQLFQTLSPKDNTESTGIGLALVKKIVESHDGRVWVQSSLDKGSTFFFTLPMKAAFVSKEPRKSYATSVK
jgi:signal transduction histidine kinase